MSSPNFLWILLHSDLIPVRKISCISNQTIPLLFNYFGRLKLSKLLWKIFRPFKIWLQTLKFDNKHEIYIICKAEMIVWKTFRTKQLGEWEKFLLSLPPLYSPHQFLLTKWNFWSLLHCYVWVYYTNASTGDIYDRFELIYRLKTTLLFDRVLWPIIYD